MRRVCGRSETGAVDDLPAPGETLVTRVYARRRRGIWSTSSRPRRGDREFTATWRYPSVTLWKRIQGSGRGDDSRVWVHGCLGASFLALEVDGDRLTPASQRAVLDYHPGMIPVALVRELSRIVSLSTAETLRIERECFSLWTSKGSGLRNPHPILADVIWSMSLHEKFGISSWGNLDQIHVKVYAVMRKAMECYSQAQEINIQAITLRQRAQRESGVGPGGAFGPQRR